MKTPDAIVKKVYDATVAVLRTPEIKEKFGLQGAEPVGNTPAEYLAQIKAEYAKMKTIVDKKGIKLE
jgi:tripartite-type tricarboxylate transporter receptor subunit TctC